MATSPAVTLGHDDQGRYDAVAPPSLLAQAGGPSAARPWCGKGGCAGPPTVQGGLLLWWGHVCWRMGGRGFWLALAMPGGGSATSSSGPGPPQPEPGGWSASPAGVDRDDRNSLHRCRNSSNQAVSRRHDPHQTTGPDPKRLPDPTDHVIPKFVGCEFGTTVNCFSSLILPEFYNPFFLPNLPAKWQTVSANGLEDLLKRLQKYLFRRSFELFFFFLYSSE